MKKKIFINIRQLQDNYTGVQSYIYNLVSHLIKQDPGSIYLLGCVSYKGGNQFIEDLLKHPNTKLINSSIPRMPATAWYYDLFFVTKYLHGIDIYFNPVNIVPFIKRAHTKYIVGVLDLCTFIVPQTTTWSLKTYYDLLLKGSLQRADSIISISENTKKDLHRLFYIPLQKITTIPLGIDQSLVDGQAAPVSKTLATFGLQEHSRYFLALGTSPRKNIEAVLSAFAIHHQSFPKSKLLVIVNNSSMVSRINNQLSLLGLARIVRLTNRYISKSELKVLYANALALVYCPFYEGFGLPILEAMQNKCPVITSNNSSLPEVVGEAGIMVTTTDGHSIAAAMRLFVTDKNLRQRLIHLGVKRASLFSWERASNNLLKLFDSSILKRG